MPNITAHRNKDGKLVAFYIRVYRGRDKAGKQLTPYSKTFKVDPAWNEKKAFKEAQKAALIFENECDSLVKPSLDEDRFIPFAQKTIARKFASEEIKLSTYERYQDLLSDLKPYMGDKSLVDITARFLDELYAQLRQNGHISLKALAKPEFTAFFTSNVDNSILALRNDTKSLLYNGVLSKPKLAHAASIAESTVRRAAEGYTVNADKAEAIAAVLRFNVDELFEITSIAKPLSGKTIREYHNLISTVLAEATRYELIKQNPATLVKSPKYNSKDVTYYSPDQVKTILQCVLEEPMEWRALLILMIYSGARRGEVLGLCRNDIDFERNEIYFHRNLLRSKTGLYLTTTKTSKSTRIINLPPIVMDNLRSYLDWREYNGLYPTGTWSSYDLVFLNAHGTPYHPDSVSQRVKKLAARYPALNDLNLHPHAFRHTLASTLIDAGESAANVASILGHSTPTTTANIYTHVFESSRRRMTNTVDEAYSLTKAPEGSVEN